MNIEKFDKDELILNLLSENSRLGFRELGDMVGLSEESVAARVAELEKSGVICGYMALIDWERTAKNVCQARIELKVTPKEGHGFDEIAETIAQFDEVESVCLMSGGYDLDITVVAESFKDIAMFVASRVAPLEDVVSTKTTFMLRKYKDKGKIARSEDVDMRIDIAQG